MKNTNKNEKNNPKNSGNNNAIANNLAQTTNNEIDDTLKKDGLYLQSKDLLKHFENLKYVFHRFNANPIPTENIEIKSKIPLPS